MPHTILEDQLVKRPFEFWPAIGLDDLHRPSETAGHGRPQERGPILAGQSGPQDHLRFLRIDIHTGEGKHLAKGHGIQLNGGATSSGNWYDAAWLIGPPRDRRTYRSAKIAYILETER